MCFLLAIASILFLPYHQVVSDIETSDDVANFFKKYSDNGDFFSDFQRLDAINTFLDDIEKVCKHLANCGVQSFGETLQSRPIHMVKISNGQPKNNAIWVDGGFHAREWLSQSSVSYVIRQLLFHSRNKSHPTYGVDWYVAPVVNPDGYVQSWKNRSTRLHRKTMRSPDSCEHGFNGVDLNRNFDFHWNERPGSSTDPCKDDYAGPSPFSESESRAVRDVLMRRDIPWKAYVSVHAFGEVIYYPYANENRLPENHEQLGKVAEAMTKAIERTTGEKYRYGSTGRLTGHFTTGSSDDWALDVLKFPFSYTLEVRPDDRLNQSVSAFIASETAILPSGKEIFAAMEVLAQAVKNLPSVSN